MALTDADLPKLVELLNQVQIRMQQRRKPAADWTSSGEVLRDGEIGLVDDAPDGAPALKVGDGLRAFDRLPFRDGAASSGGIVTPSGTSYTPIAADNGNTVVSGSSDPFTLMLPADADVALRVGALIGYQQGAAGAVTVVAGTGVTLYAPNGASTAQQWDGGVAQKLAANTWVLWNGPSLGPLATAADAPNDGNTYGRKNGGWSAVGGTSGPNPNLAGINEQTGTTYALVLADAGKDVRCTNAAAIAVTVPADADAAFDVGTLIALSQGGAGAVTAVGAAGVTVSGAHGLATTGVEDARVLEKRAANTWSVW